MDLARRECREARKRADPDMVMESIEAFLANEAPQIIQALREKEEEERQWREAHGLNDDEEDAY